MNDRENPIITFEGPNAKWIQNIRLENGMTVAEFERQLHDDLEKRYVKKHPLEVREKR